MKTGGWCRSLSAQSSFVFLALVDMDHAHRQFTVLETHLYSENERFRNSPIKFAFLRQVADAIKLRMSARLSPHVSLLYQLVKACQGLSDIIWHCAG
jgi:hypothetical protein